MDGLVNEETTPPEEDPNTVAEPVEIKEKPLKKTKAKSKVKKALVQPVEP